MSDSLCALHDQINVGCKNIAYSTGSTHKLKCKKLHSFYETISAHYLETSLNKTLRPILV